jgi:hypothetical protein
MPKNRAATWFLVSTVALWIGLAAAEPPEWEPRAAQATTAEPQPPEEPAAPEIEENALAGRGVVVESVGKGSALEKAGRPAAGGCDPSLATPSKPSGEPRGGTR